MAITSDVLIDLALNAIGYLAAGALSILVYSMIVLRRKEEVLSETSVQTEPEPRETRPSETAQFVPLSGARTDDVTMKRAAAVDEPDSPKSLSRKEVLGLARKMLMAGTPATRILQVLPISETEMALLGMVNDR